MSAPPSCSQPNRQDKFTLIALGVILAVFGAVVFWPANMAGDFHLFYAAGLIPSDQIYDLDVQRAVEERLFAEHYPEDYFFTLGPFFRPAYYKAILTPLAQLPFWTAYWVWSALQILSMAGAILLLSRRFGFEPSLAVLLPLCLPAWAALSWGQDFWLVFFLVCASLELAMRKRDGWAGVVLALSLVKWNVLLLLPVTLAAKKRWRMLGAFCAAALAEVGVTFALIGRKGFEDYFVAIQDPSAEAFRFTMPSLRGLLLNIGLPDAAIAVVLLAAATALVWSIREAPFEEAFALAAAGSAFLSAHTMMYDFAFFFLPLLVLKPHRSSRLAAVVIALSFTPVGEWTAALTSLSVRGVYATAVAAVVVWEWRRRSNRSPVSAYSPEPAGSLSNPTLRTG